MQITYMKNMVRMREDQFSEGVKRSLYAVVTDLEQDETKHYLEQDFSMLKPMCCHVSNSQRVASVLNRIMVCRSIGRLPATARCRMCSAISISISEDCSTK